MNRFNRIQLVPCSIYESLVELKNHKSSLTRVQLSVSADSNCGLGDAVLPVIRVFIVRNGQRRLKKNNFRRKIFGTWIMDLNAINNAEMAE